MKRAPHPAYVAIDVETTGIRPGTDRIYEIALITYDSLGRLVDRYETLVRPDGHDLSARLAPHLDSAPAFAEIAGDVVSRLAAGVVVGHSVAFDLAMVDAECQRLGAALPEVPYLCTSEIALGLHIDSPNRTLGMLCRVLGVEMSSWHTALGDAEATSALLGRLLEVADGRGLGETCRKPGVFPGSASEWPALPSGGRVLIRNPETFPPVGEKPDDVDPLEVKAKRVLSIELPVTLSERAAEVLAALKAAKGVDPGTTAKGRAGSDDWDAWDDWEAGAFKGKRGIDRLRRIKQAFLNDDDEEVWEVALRLAQALRFDPSQSADEVSSAYEEALELARAVDEETGDDEDEDAYGAAEAVIDDWADFLRAREDADGLVRLIGMVPLAQLDDGFGAAAFVHRMRTAGQHDAVLHAAEVLSRALGDAGAGRGAADVCAEWAQALDELGNNEEALAVCGRSWAAGWSSRDLANRHSLLLERRHEWPGAITVCERGLAMALDDAQLARRRERCQRILALRE